MLKIRGSVVEITNAKGKKGMGLVISDSFVLTSAGLVNKLQNTYDVKTINGDVLKAKAVRVNPSKNTALMHLEKPVTYTPIALNLDLPPIDQEATLAGAAGQGTAKRRRLYGRQRQNLRLPLFRYARHRNYRLIRWCRKWRSAAS